MALKISDRFAGSRQLTAREKLILRLGLVMAALMVLVNGVPAVTGIYKSRALQLEALQVDIEREQRLIDDEELWLQRREQAEQQVLVLENRLFVGGSVALLTAAIQRQVRQIAGETGLSITSANLAENKQSGNWILVEQTISFNTTDQNNTLVFLQRLEEAQPSLKVTRFSMRRTRNQYNGDITVVGFSRAGSPALVARQAQ